MSHSSSPQPTAIVTGAAHGIGAAIAGRLAVEGWRVVAADVDAAGAQAIAARTGGHAIVCDVARESDIVHLVDETSRLCRRIDAVVSNAGISRFKPLAETTLEDWRAVLDTNLTAAFLLARTAAAGLASAKGSLVTIASTRAHMSEPDTVAYSASKGGLVALTHALAVTLGPDVRVNCISPGWIDTSRHGPLRAEDHAQHPVGRVGRPEDIAAAVSFLLSAEAGFITGAELIVDGGMTRKMIYV